jgi:U6 snRNA-associated Sm-like protein LSm7
MAAEAGNILKKKASVLSLEKHLDRPVFVILRDEKELRGVLKGFDNNVNLTIANGELWSKEGRRLRGLGPVVVRGGSVVTVMSGDTAALATNPFL